MTKAEFVEKFAEKTGFSKKDAAAAVDAYHAVIADAMKAGDKIVIPGVVKVEVKESAARTGRNPQTGEEMQIPAKKAIKAAGFKVGEITYEYDANIGKNYVIWQQYQANSQLDKGMTIDLEVSKGAEPEPEPDDPDDNEENNDDNNND